jgi:hypothetical protein
VSSKPATTSFGQERRIPTWTACVAHLRVDRATGNVTVESAARQTK